MKPGIFILVALALLAGCTSTTSEDHMPIIDNLNETADLQPVDTAKTVGGNNRFAVDFYSMVSDRDENIFFSPFSFSSALAMTYEGAKGTTASEMESALHLDSNSASRRAAFAGLNSELNAPGKNFTLSVANALWVQNDYRLLPDYTQVAGIAYSARVSNLDFARDSEGSRQTINSWVEDKTHDKITNLIPQGVLTPGTRLVLTNAIYFKGSWKDQFDKSLTMEEDFRAPGKTVKAQMMRRTGRGAGYNYAEVDGIQILEMPYSGDELSMIVVLPEQGKLAEAERSLKSFEDWRAQLSMQRVDVYFPRFRMETQYFASGELKKLGMKSAFDTSADFSGIDGSRGLYIQAVIHKAFVEVNEEGTEAAAATAVVVGITSIGVEKPIPVFRADRPFIFMIYHKKSGSILFMGRVSDPSR
ncbi:serpin family protein [Candidatus Woesearchaeota archaeon]|nr:serpin family protein [Candidatus Woesearchaeota archaeon]